MAGRDGSAPAVAPLAVSQRAQQQYERRKVSRLGEPVPGVGEDDHETIEDLLI
jgi:hypothetical protein